MPQQVIDIGTIADDRTGDPGRISFDKCNDNFTELYSVSLNSSGTVDGGNQYFDGHIAVGSDSAINTNRILNIKESVTDDGAESYGVHYDITLGGTAATAGLLTALKGLMDYQATPTLGSAQIRGFDFTVRTSSTSTVSTMTGAYLVMSTGAGSGTITTARGIQVAPSFAVQPVNARGIDIENMGTTSGGLTATGIYIQKQLNSFITEGIYLNGDGIGADIVFGTGRDANIYYDGTDLVIDAALKGTGTLNLISQAANAITTETLNEYVTIKINGVNKKIAIVA